MVVDLDPSDQSVRVELQPDRQAISIQWLGGAQRIPLAWVKLRFGEAPLFDPEDGPRCTSLYLGQGRFVSRRTLGLAYVSQRMDADERRDLRLVKITERLEGAGGRKRARGAPRLLLLKALNNDQERLGPEVWAQLDAAAASLRAKRRRRPLKSDPLQSTRWALLRGRIRQPRLTSSEVLVRLERSWRIGEGAAAIPTGLAPFVGPVLARSVFPELDLRALRPRRGRAGGHKLVWDTGDEACSALVALVGEGATCRLRIEIRTSTDAAPVRQEIVAAGGRRPGDLFLLCPVSGRRVLKLYLREGRFASAQAQRLR